MKIRVVEIRQAENGWVVTAFERQAQGPYIESVYTTRVAESVDHLMKVVGDLARKDTWEQARDIAPARLP